MKIYFTGSMSGKAKYGKNYEAVVETLETLGHVVYEDTTKVTTNYVYTEISDEDKVKYYKKVVKWMNLVDVVVCEASNSSLSVGHEISLALDKGKPVVVLFSEGEAPHFLVGIQSDKLIVQKYNLDNLEEKLKDALEYAASQQDTRFNFFVSPRIATYLDWISKQQKVPRAVYLRGLIKSAMSDDKQYRGEENL